MTVRKPAHLKGYVQLRLHFEKGVNRRGPTRDGHQSGKWRIWCGWCQKDHRYPAYLTEEKVRAMHEDQIENICKVRACGEDPFG